MKKLRRFLILLLILIVPVMVNAGSGTIKVTSTSTVVVGNKVTVTVTLSSGTSIGSWQMQLNYDKSYLQLTSADTEGGSVRMAASSASGVKSKKYTFTFKTLKKGSTNVSVGSYLAYAFDDLSEISLTSSSKTIKIITQEELEASYSKDNNLKSLSVEGFEINEEFSKDVLQYSVNVPEGTTSINVKAEASDSKASVSGDGTVNVTEGVNNLSIVVRAENGSEKTYNLVVNVIDQNPIEVKIGNVPYTVIKLRSNYSCPSLYEETEITINEFAIPACINKKINYQLVGLKKEDGTVEHFVYNEGKYKKYEELVGTSMRIIPVHYDKEIDGLSKHQEKIDGKEYNVYKFNNSKKFYVVYGANIENGERDLYLYDVKNKTFSLYNEEHVNYLLETNRIYMYVIITFGVGLLLSIICVISLYVSKRRLLKEIKKNSNKVKDKKKAKTKEKEEESA